MGLEPLESRRLLAVWDGGGGDSFWMTADNWVGNAAPVAGDVLEFPAGALQPSNSNDFPALTSFASITFSGSGYTLGGNSIALTGDITASAAAGTSDVNLAIQFLSAPTITSTTAGTTLTLGGPIDPRGNDLTFTGEGETVVSGVIDENLSLAVSSGLVKNGSGRLRLDAVNDYSEPTVVNAGELEVLGSIVPSAVHLAGGVLTGDGTVGPIVSQAGGGTVAPGRLNYAVLTAIGNVTFNAETTLFVGLNGNTPGVNQDQLAVQGSVDLSVAHLTVGLQAGFNPLFGTSFVILNNDGVDAIVGTFAGLSEGSALTLDGQLYQISYAGGTGNDVVLTRVEPIRFTACGDHDLVNQDDVFSVRLSGGNVQVFINDPTYANLPAFNQPLALVQQVNVIGVGGNDELIVDASGGLVALPRGIRYDGDGQCDLPLLDGEIVVEQLVGEVGYDRGFDKLTLVGGDTSFVSDVLAVGAQPGSGVSTIRGAAGEAQVVFFEELEPVTDTVATATFTIDDDPDLPPALAAQLSSLLGRANAISYSAYAGAAIPGVTNAGQIRVDEFEPIVFANKAEIAIDAGGGQDEISLRNATTPDGLVGIISVSGGDPGGIDTLSLTGTASAETFEYRPTDVDAGRVLYSVGIGGGAVALPDVVFDQVEQVEIDGQSADDDDLLRLRTLPGRDTVVLSPRTALDAGDLQVVDDAGIESTPPLHYLNIGQDANLEIVADAELGRQDVLRYFGTLAGDVFELQSTGDVVLDTRHVVQTPGVTRVELVGLAGDDLFRVRGSHPFSSVQVEGGEPGASDVLALLGSGGSITVDLQPATIIHGASGPVGYVGIERVDLDGVADGDSLTVNGTIGDEHFQVTPSAAGSGHFQVSSTHSLVAESPLFTYQDFSEGFVTFNGGAAFDVLDVLGSEAPDVVTSDATSVTIRGGTVTLGADLERLDLHTLGGGDSVVLSGLAINKIVDAGPGDDFVNATAAVDATILGGDGNDNLLGSPAADLIDGGRGDDTIRGNGGVDEIFGSEGSDVVSWTVGDGDDVIEGGGSEADVLRVIGSAADETINVFADHTTPARVRVTDSASGESLSAAGIEEIDIQALTGSDAIDVGRANGTALADPLSDLSTTEVQVVRINLDAFVEGAVPLDASADTIFWEGRPLDDNLLASLSGGTVTVAGLPYDLKVSNIDPTRDRLTVRGNEGNDQIKAVDGVEAAIQITLDGNQGDDRLSADAIILGGPGDDFLEGGAGNDMLFGNEGDDTMIGLGGDDTFDGGDGVDTILVLGTPGNDRIDAAQTAADTLVHTVNGNTQTDTIVLVAGVPSVEVARIEAGAGNDTLRVSVVDALVATPASSLRFDVDGGDNHTSDRLAVRDDGLGDLVIYRKGQDDSTGSIAVGPLAPVNFQNVEFVDVTPLDPISDGTGADSLGRLVVFKHDPFENNNALAVATHLGAGRTINVDPTIDPGPDLPFELPGDEDWYRVEAEVTGTLDFSVFFQPIGTLGNGRPGLPAGGHLSIEVRDASGDAIVPAFQTADTDDAHERVRMPAVAGQVYYLRVRGAGELNLGINNYSLTILNEPAPAPFDLELDDVIAIGSVTVGTSTTQFNGNAALSASDDFYNGKQVAFTSGALQGQQAIVLDYVGATRTFTLATALSATPAVGDTFQIESVDTGRSQLDDYTRDNTPTVLIRLDDNVLLHDLPGNATDDAPVDDVIPIPFSLAGEAGYRVGVFVEDPVNGAEVFVGFAAKVAGQDGIYSFTFPAALADGSHFIHARVQMIDPAAPERQTGFGPQSQSLEIVVNTDVPPVFFGTLPLGSDGLDAASDSGVLGPGNAATFTDRITSDKTPRFFGTAEANAVVRVYADVNANGLVDAADILLGMTVAVPQDGTNQFPNGRWVVDSAVDLNDPALFAGLDGTRTILATAEDLAGNVNQSNDGVGDAGQILRVFVDTQGPQVTAVELTEDPVFDLFDPKPSAGPTPLSRSLTISFRDLPNRDNANFPNYFALVQSVAADPGNYLLRGDANGVIPIESVQVTLNPPVNNQPATATVVLEFVDFLPDDRFTLTVSDNLVDPAGNHLDGESNALEPQEEPNFPTGDGVPGGSFVARFTIDSRPEIGTWSGGSVYIDTNGNRVFDPTNADFVNRDIVYVLGFASDDIFAGNFTEDDDGEADGFDKLAAYGLTPAGWRFLIDTDNDGVPNLTVLDPAGINGLPVAGDFDGNADNGDEVGIFTGSVWHLDTDHDFRVDDAISTNLRGFPIVGDFDGDGADDLATWNEQLDRFEFDLADDGFGSRDATIAADFIGARERPVAADLDQDGIDDVGLWSPDHSGQTPHEAGEWYFLVSNDHEDGEGGGLREPGTVNTLDHEFTPIPFGHDEFAQFGDEFAIPIVGNFDPPTVAGSGEPEGSASTRQTGDPLDIDGDGRVVAVDALMVIDQLNLGGARAMASGMPSAVDTNGDGRISPVDALLVINRINAAAGARAASLAPLGDALPLSAAEALVDGELLDALAEDAAAKRKRL